MLKAVTIHKQKNRSPIASQLVIDREHDVEQGVAILNKARNEPLPEGLSKDERLDLLVQALGQFVGVDEEHGSCAESVWDVSPESLSLHGLSSGCRFCTLSLESCSIPTNLSHTSHPFFGIKTRRSSTISRPSSAILPCCWRRSARGHYRRTPRLRRPSLHLGMPRWPVLPFASSTIIPRGLWHVAQCLHLIGPTCSGPGWAKASIAPSLSGAG